MQQQRLPKTAAIDILTDLIRRLRELSGHSYQDQRFPKWHTDSEVAFRNLFGKGSQQLAAFNKISFSPIALVRGTWQPEEHLAMKDGIVRGIALLEASIVEIRTYWPDDKASINHHAAKAEQITSAAVYNTFYNSGQVAAMGPNASASDTRQLQHDDTSMERKRIAIARMIDMELDRVVRLAETLNRDSYSVHSTLIPPSLYLTQYRSERLADAIMFVVEEVHDRFVIRSFQELIEAARTSDVLVAQLAAQRKAGLLDAEEVEGATEMLRSYAKRIMFESHAFKENAPRIWQLALS